jgi:hypothetical protein
MPLVRAYLEAIGCDPETGEKVGEYMELLTTYHLLLTTYYLREGGRVHGAHPAACDGRAQDVRDRGLLEPQASRRHRSSKSSCYSDA